MARRILAALLMGGAALFLPATTVLAHEGGEEATILVEPASVTAGGTVLVAGTNLEPDSKRVLLLKGENVIVEFGSVATDGEGMLSRELTIPAHLPSGVYQLQAIGDETLVAELKIQAVQAAAGNLATPTPEQPVAGPAAEAGGSMPEPQDRTVPTPVSRPDETVVSDPRPRSGLDLAAIVALAALIGGLGAVLVLRAERIGSPARRP